MLKSVFTYSVADVSVLKPLELLEWQHGKAHQNSRIQIINFKFHSGRENLSHFILFYFIYLIFFFFFFGFACGEPPLFFFFY